MINTCSNDNFRQKYNQMHESTKQKHSILCRHHWRLGGNLVLLLRRRCNQRPKKHHKMLINWSLEILVWMPDTHHLICIFQLYTFVRHQHAGGRACCWLSALKQIHRIHWQTCNVKIATGADLTCHQHHLAHVDVVKQWRRPSVLRIYTAKDAIVYL